MGKRGGRDRERSASWDSTREFQSATVLYVSTLPTFFFFSTADAFICHWPSGFVTPLKATVQNARTTASPVEPQISQHLPSLIQAARAQTENPDGAVQAFTVCHDSLIWFPNRAEVSRGYVPSTFCRSNAVAHQKRRLSCQPALLTPWRPPRSLCIVRARVVLMEFQEERDVLRAQRRKTKNKSV